ncbi:MAG: glycosyltransferase family 39 protein, partial [Candidatus Gottesmanbacteria bacterium]|nr:glycosyltransferase family 39 protein [Candidatus Gottesmanbacteria bacterium]
WSPHSAYTNRQSYVNPKGGAFTLVTPYLEHPPLFGLVAGGFALLTGEHSFGDLQIPTIRFLALALGTLSIYAVYLVAREAYGKRIGLLSGFLYAIIPSVAVGSRLVQNENFFIPFFLLSLYFLQRYLKTDSRRYFWLSTGIAAVLPLAKVPWIAAPAAVSFILLYKRRVKDTFAVVICTAFCFSLFLIYGFAFDPQLFIKLWQLQLARYDLNFDSVFALFQIPYLTDRLYLDGWIYAGWAALLLVSRNIKKHYVILFGFFAYFLVFVLAIPNEPGHGWYRYPFYPFLTISLAVIAREVFNKDWIPTYFFLLLTGLSMLANVWTPLLGFSYVIYRSYIFLCSAGLIPIVLPNKRFEKIISRVNYVTLLVVFCVSVWSLLSYTEQ